MKDQFQLDDNLDRGQLLTELSHSSSQDLDKLNTLELVELFSKEDIEPQIAVSRCLPEISKAIESILPKLKSGGRLFYIGAGTSGRLGVLDASECPPTFCSSPELIQGLIAGGDKSLRNSSEELEDSDSQSISDLRLQNFSSRDCLVGITSGGTTPYVISALQYAIELEALAIAISCVRIDQVQLPCDIDIRLLTGPELLTGSTRLKAGTATKMTLNMISTIIMIRLGKVYGNKMIDLSVSNNKLLDRALRILEEIANIDRKKGQELITDSQGSVKVSLLMYLASIDYKTAIETLNNQNQNLRKALAKHDIFQ